MSKKNQMNQANDPVNSIVGLDLFADFELADLVELSEQDLHQVSGGVNVNFDFGLGISLAPPLYGHVGVTEGGFNVNVQGG